MGDTTIGSSLKSMCIPADAPVGTGEILLSCFCSVQFLGNLRNVSACSLLGDDVLGCSFLQLLLNSSSLLSSCVQVFRGNCCVEFLDDSFQIVLDYSVLSSLFSSNFYSLLCGFDISHVYPHY